MEKAWNEAQLINQSNMANLDPTFIAAKAKEEQEAILAKKMLEDTWQ